jgi:hypothetical protein
MPQGGFWDFLELLSNWLRGLVACLMQSKSKAEMRLWVLIFCHSTVLNLSPIYFWSASSHSLSLLCWRPINEATLKPNVSTFCELEKNVHKMCTGGGWVWNWVVNSILPSPNSFSDGKMMPPPLIVSSALLNNQLKREMARSCTRWDVSHPIFLLFLAL